MNANEMHSTALCGFIDIQDAVCQRAVGRGMEKSVRSAFPSSVRSWNGGSKWMDASESPRMARRARRARTRLELSFENYSCRTESRCCRLYQLPRERAKNLPGGEFDPRFPLLGLSSPSMSNRSTRNWRWRAKRFSVSERRRRRKKKELVIWFGRRDNFVKRCLTLYYALWNIDFMLLTPLMALARRNPAFPKLSVLFRFVSSLYLGSQLKVEVPHFEILELRNIIVLRGWSRILEPQQSENL